jgi:hypothetical protein
LSEKRDIELKACFVWDKGQHFSAMLRKYGLSGAEQCSALHFESGT